MGFLFGAKRRRSKRTSRKPPAKLLKLCKRLHVKTTKKVGRRRVYKSIKILMKQCAQKARKKAKSCKRRKTRKTRKTRRRCSQRRSGFGNVTGYQFQNPANYGYNQSPAQATPSLAQTSVYVNEQSNSSRPAEMQVPADELPIYGVYRDFYGQAVPTQMPPNWNFMGQPDGSLYPAGGLVNTYKTAFGKKRAYRRRRVVKRSRMRYIRKAMVCSNGSCQIRTLK